MCSARSSKTSWSSCRAAGWRCQGCGLAAGQAPESVPCRNAADTEMEAAGMSRRARSQILCSRPKPGVVCRAESTALSTRPLRAGHRFRSSACQEIAAWSEVGHPAGTDRAASRGVGIAACVSAFLPICGDCQALDLRRPTPARMRARQPERPRHSVAAARCWIVRKPEARRLSTPCTHCLAEKLARPGSGLPLPGRG